MKPFSIPVILSFLVWLSRNINVLELIIYLSSFTAESQTLLIVSYGEPPPPIVRFFSYPFSQGLSAFIIFSFVSFFSYNKQLRDSKRRQMCPINGVQEYSRTRKIAELPQSIYPLSYSFNPFLFEFQTKQQHRWVTVIEKCFLYKMEENSWMYMMLLPDPAATFRLVQEKNAQKIRCCRKIIFAEFGMYSYILCYKCSMNRFTFFPGKAVQIVRHSLEGTLDSLYSKILWKFALCAGNNATFFNASCIFGGLLFSYAA